MRNTDALVYPGKADKLRRVSFFRSPAQCSICGKPALGLETTKATSTNPLINGRQFARVIHADKKTFCWNGRIMSDEEVQKTFGAAADLLRGKQNKP